MTSFLKNSSIVSLSRVSLVAFFSAGSLYLSSIEYLLPRPAPFFRFGLSNIAILLIIRYFLFKDAFIVVLLKVIGLGIINGTIMSYVFVFSFLGSVTGFLSMWIFGKILNDKVSIIGISMIGASISNGIQIVCAVFFVFGKTSWIIAPYLFFLGCVSGLFVGMIAYYLLLKSHTLCVLQEQYKKELNTKKKKEKIDITVKRFDGQRKAFILILLGCFAFIPYMGTSSVSIRFAQVLIFFLLAKTVKRIKVMYFLCMILSVVLFYLLMPNGKIIGRFLWWNITEGALKEGLFRAFTLCGYVFLSLWCISPKLSFRGKIGSIFSHSLRYLNSFYNEVLNTSKYSQKRKTNNIIFYFDTILIGVLCMKSESSKVAFLEKDSKNSKREIAYRCYMNKTCNYYYVYFVVVMTYALFFIDYFFRKELL